MRALDEQKLVQAYQRRLQQLRKLERGLAGNNSNPIVLNVIREMLMEAEAEFDPSQ